MAWKRDGRESICPPHQVNPFWCFYDCFQVKLHLSPKRITTAVGWHAAIASLHRSTPVEFWSSAPIQEGRWSPCYQLMSAWLAHQRRENLVWIFHGGSARPFPGVAPTFLSSVTATLMSMPCMHRDSRSQSSHGGRKSYQA